MRNRIKEVANPPNRPREDSKPPPNERHQQPPNGTCFLEPSHLLESLARVIGIARLGCSLTAEFGPRSSSQPLLPRRRRRTAGAATTIVRRMVSLAYSELLREVEHARMVSLAYSELLSSVVVDRRRVATYGINGREFFMWISTSPNQEQGERGMAWWRVWGATGHANDARHGRRRRVSSAGHESVFDERTKRLGKGDCC